MKNAVLSLLIAASAVPLCSTQARAKSEKSTPAKKEMLQHPEREHKILLFVKGTLSVQTDDKGNVTGATIKGEDGTSCQLHSLNLAKTLKAIDGKQVMTKGVMEDEKGKRVLRVMFKIKLVPEHEASGKKKAKK